MPFTVLHPLRRERPLFQASHRKRAVFGLRAEPALVSGLGRCFPLCFQPTCQLYTFTSPPPLFPPLALRILHRTEICFFAAAPNPLPVLPPLRSPRPPPPPDFYYWPRGNGFSSHKYRTHSAFLSPPFSISQVFSFVPPLPLLFCLCSPDLHWRLKDVTVFPREFFP